jgi:hypothetical protein
LPKGEEEWNNVKESRNIGDIQINIKIYMKKEGTFAQTLVTPL